MSEIPGVFAVFCVIFPDFSSLFIIPWPFPDCKMPSHFPARVGTLFTSWALPLLRSSHVNDNIKHWVFFYYRPKRSFGQGNIFTPVCHSFCSQGVGGVPDQAHPPPGPGTPPGTRYTPPGTRYPPRDQVHTPPPPPRSSNLWNTVNDRPVRILLECILVLREIRSSYSIEIDVRCVCTRVAARTSIAMTYSQTLSQRHILAGKTPMDLFQMQEVNVPLQTSVVSNKVSVFCLR